MNTLFIVGLSFVGIGVIFKNFYKKGFFDNSISMPIVVFGIFLTVISIAYEIQIKKAINFKEVDFKAIEKIRVSYSYYTNEFDNLEINGKNNIEVFKSYIDQSLLLSDQSRSRYSWYIESEVSLDNEEMLIIMISGNCDAMYWNQIHKLWFVPISGPEYKLPTDFREYLFEQIGKEAELPCY